MPLDRSRLSELLNEIAAKQAEEIKAEAITTAPVHFGGPRRSRRLMMGTMSGYGTTTTGSIYPMTTYNPYAYGRMVNIAVVKPYGWSTYSHTITPTGPTYETVEVMSLGNGKGIDLKTGEMHAMSWTARY